MCYLQTIIEKLNFFLQVRDEWKEDGMKPVEDILVPLNKEPLLPNCTDGYNMT